MLDALQSQLNYYFQDPGLLEQAITHRSYLNENADYNLGHNERLEFLGDSVIELITSNYLYHRFPDMSEGYMTRLRAGLVRTETLADFATMFNLGQIIRMAKGEEDSGGRDRQSVLCDCFEALMGAIYLDSGIDSVREIILPIMEPVLDDILAFDRDKDAKSRFQEWSQATLSITPAYRTIIGMGEEHDMSFVVELLINDTPVGWGEGRSKQIAQQAAARQALKAVRNKTLPFDIPADSEYPIIINA